MVAKGQHGFLRQHNKSCLASIIKDNTIHGIYLLLACYSCFLAVIKGKSFADSTFDFYRSKQCSFIFAHMGISLLPAVPGLLSGGKIPP